MRSLVLAGLILLALLSLWHAWDDEPTREFGSGVRVAEVLVAKSPSVNPYAAQVDLGPRFLELVNASHPRPRRKPTRPHVQAAAGSVNGYPCGGTLPPCYVLERESHGNPTARNPHSSASGLWQFLDSTWAGFMGYERAYLAPAWVQNLKAEQTWNHGRGCSHWSAC